MKNRSAFLFSKEKTVASSNSFIRNFAFYILHFEFNFPTH